MRECGPSGIPLEEIADSGGEQCSRVVIPANDTLERVLLKRDSVNKKRSTIGVIAQPVL